MITLSLLHPIKQIPVQVWTFENESVIRIGRSTDNQVILYSAVVSRHHVELRRVGNGWEVVNLGTNGTYLDGKRITQMSVSDGSVIRLARSGPNIQIRIGSEALKSLSKGNAEERTLGQRHDYPIMSTDITKQSIDDLEDEGTDIGREFDGDTVLPSLGTIPVPPHLRLNSVSGFPVSGFPVTAQPQDVGPPPVITAIQGRRSTATLSPTPTPCTHSRATSAFCPDCGQPVHVLHTVGDYHVLKVLGQGDIGITYLAWHHGTTLVLKTVNSRWCDNPRASEALECEADILRQIQHPHIPHLYDCFAIANQTYLSMELIKGQSLSSLMETPFELVQVVRWMVELCRILDYLHSFVPPLLHRGLRPQSLIPQPSLDNPDAIALVDFGLIKSLVLGEPTPATLKGYVLPDHLDINASPAVDLYSLGPLMAHLLTGQHPASFYADRGQGSRFYADLIPGIPPALVTVINTLTHPQTEARYPSAGVAAEALQSVALKV